MALTREQRVRILCSTMLDYLPGPKTWGGTLARSSSPGPVTQEVAPCTVCLGRGRIQGQQRACLLCPSKIRYQGPPRLLPEHRCRPCAACNGSGWRPRLASEEPHDPMTGMSQSELVVAVEAPAPPVSPRRGPPDPLLGDEEPLEVARRARDRSGSYQELERALEKMRDEYPQAYVLVMHILVYGEPIQLSLGAETILDDGVLWLATEMRSVRVPRSEMESPEREEARKRSLWRGRTLGHERQRGERNARILARYQEGVKVNAIAVEFGIRREHVHRIVREA